MHLRLFFHAPLGLLCIVVLVEIGHRHVGALAGEQHCDRAADARIRSSDERNFAQQLLRALVVRGVKHRRELEIGLVAWLLQVLVWKRRLGIDAGSGLHGFILRFLLARGALVRAVDLLLDGTLSLGGLFGFFLEGFGV